MKVYVDNHKPEGEERIVVEAVVVERINGRRIKVRLPDGNIVKRRLE